METDPLKRFIQENRQAFEDDFMPHDTWKEIESKLPSPTHQTIYKTWLKIAATIIVILASGIIYMWMDQQNKQTNITAQQPSSGAHNAEQDLKEAEHYYATVITERKQELFSMTADMPEIKQDVQIEFAELDSVYKQLRIELKNNTSNETVINAMIQNYRIRLQLLEDMLYYINKVQNTNTKTQHYEL